MDGKEPFLNRMLRWMSHDVNICMAGDANVGAMTLMLTDIAALAGFYAGRTELKLQNDHDEFVLFFEEFFDLAKDKRYDQLIYKLVKDKKKSIKDRCIIYDDFRCGVVHEHLMKQGTAIDKGLEKPYVFMSLSSGELTINIDHFFADYLNALSKYADRVRNDANVADKFKKRAEYLGAYQPYL